MRNDFLETKMRVISTMSAVSAAALALTGCSKEATTPASTATTASVPAATSTATPASTATGDAGFTPPTSISRADYGGRMERRFRKLDKNGDGKLGADELSDKRGAKILKRLDKNGDNAVDSSEWSTGMLARFDKADANGDGNLTSEERGAKGKAGKGGKRKKDMIPDEGDEVDNGF